MPLSTLERLKTIAQSDSNQKDKKTAITSLLAGLPASGESMQAFEAALGILEQLENIEERQNGILEFNHILPKGEAFSELHMAAIIAATDAVALMEDAKHRKSALLRLAEDIPEAIEFSAVYGKTMERVMEAADKINDKFYRRFSLSDISEKLKRRGGFDDLALRAIEVALGLSDDPSYKKFNLDEVAKELPKTCDITFYQNHTFLGIATNLPKRGKFLELYKKALDVGIRASNTLDEPYYRKYALFFIAESLPKNAEFAPFYERCLTDSFKAAITIKEPFVKTYALIDLLQELPKTREFMGLIVNAIEEILPFFSVKSRMADVEALEVVDFIIVAEERKMTESKKRRYTRGNYARLFTIELEKFSEILNDARLLEILKPYIHVWIRPVELRETLKKLSERIEALKSKFHGKEIERPVFVKEERFSLVKKDVSKTASAKVKETIAIDLGATNTVIMKKHEDAEPEFVYLDGLSKKYGDTYIVPTYIHPDTGSIGADAKSLSSLNIKKMLLENDPAGADYMARYLRTLYRHIKGSIPHSGWLSILTAKPADKICVTVPVGFQTYRKTIGEIFKGMARGVEIDFVEEPLAAAIGYQIAEKRDKVALIIDFGGCTLDVMLLRLNTEEVHVVAKPDRSTMLGGRDIDFWLASHLAKRLGFSEDTIPPKVLVEAEDIKIALSEHRSVPFEWDGKEVRVTREDFETTLASHEFYETIDRAISYVFKKAKKLGVTKDMVEAVLLTGGSSQIPSFKDKITALFPELRKLNAVYDHSPLSAVAKGAALYGTKAVVDRHLAVAYALRHTIKDKEKKDFFEIVLEKGESLPLEKTFMARPAATLGPQDELFLELFEVPETFIVRRWVNEADMEFIKQTVKTPLPEDVVFKGFKIITLPLGKVTDEDVLITFKLDETGNLKIKYGPEGKEVETGLRLQ